MGLQYHQTHQASATYFPTMPTYTLKLWKEHTFPLLRCFCYFITATEKSQIQMPMVFSRLGKISAIILLSVFVSLTFVLHVDSSEHVNIVHLVESQRF